MTEATRKETFDWTERVPRLPEEPGVYVMRDKRGKIIYVGKSVNLRARVRSYFNGTDTRPFVSRLPHVLGEIETTVTSTEKEALLLENTLIKAHKPRYNVKLVDDKNYLSLKIDTRAKWPRVVVTRRIGRDGRHFGPYHTATSIRRTLRVLNKHFMLRTCPDSVLNNRTRPCLQYQIKRCPGPCVFDVDEDVYQGHVQDAILFLEGRSDELVDRLHKKMLSASDTLEYELAAHYRDQIRAIDTARQKQQAVSTQFVDQDLVALYRQGDRVTFVVLTVRRGRLEGSESFSFKDQEFPDEEVLSTFLVQLYASGRPAPKELVVPIDMEDADALAELLSEERNAQVKVIVPKRGTRKDLLDTAMRNAKHAFEEEHNEAERIQDTLAKLEKKLRLTKFPYRIECFDISNFQGEQMVGSMVVMENGRLNNKEYRHFKVRSVEGQDDFAAMYEVLQRRMSRSLHDDWPVPDLVVIDGGKGQLGQAVTVMSDLGVHDVDVVALAKARVERDMQAAEIRRSLERVFLPGRKNALVLRQNSAELFLLQQIRDEAHRFAIEFHRKLRRKRTLSSKLDEIPGVGKKRRKALLSHFGSLDRVRRASVVELTTVEGISASTARTVFAFFNSEAALDAADES